MLNLKCLNLFLDWLFGVAEQPQYIRVEEVPIDRKRHRHY